MATLNQLQTAWWIAEQASLPLAGVSTHFVLELELDERVLADPDLRRLERAWGRVVEEAPLLRARVAPDTTLLLSDSAPGFERLDLGVPRDEQRKALVRLSQRVRDEDIPLSGPAPHRITAARLDGARWWLGVRFNFALLDYASIVELLSSWGRAFLEPGAPLDLRTRAERSVASEGTAVAPAHSAQALPPAPALSFAREPRAIGRPSPLRLDFVLDAPRTLSLEAAAEARGLRVEEVVYAAFALTVGTWADGAAATLTFATFERDEAAGLGDACTLGLVPTPALDDRPLADFMSRAILAARAAFPAAAQEVLGTIRRRLERDGAGFPVVFTDLTRGVPRGGLERAIRWLGLEHGLVTRTPQVWLDCQLRRDGDRLVVAWDHPRGLFEEETLAAAFEGFNVLLDTLSQPQTWEGPLDLVCAELRSPAERELQAHANDTTRPWPASQRDATLCSRVLAQAGRTPDAPAVVTEEATLSYRELVRRASAVCAWVERHAAKQPGTPCNVAVWMQKSAEEVVAALGIMLSGRSYLPIDAALPLSRQQQLAELGRPVAIVTTAGTELSVADRPVLRLGTDELPDSAELADRSRPSDLAYVVFTSGSTGVPKGVMIRHESAVNTLLDVETRFELGPRDRSFGLSALSFDLSVWDIFGPLAVGGAVVIPTGPARRDPVAWARLIERHQVSVWSSVPASLGALLDTLEVDERALPAPLRLVALSGDWIPLSLPDRARQGRPGLRVVSLGGATEGSIWSIAHAIDDVDPAWRSIPYGRPLANQRMRVLHRNLAPCPTGVTGELFIGGAGVAAGYLNDAGRTATSFLEHPRTGEKLYRTGDFGRYRSDGAIEFLGRRDSQVKIQGHRVELGEIEAAAATVTSVNAVVARAFGERDGRRWIALYVVPRPGQVVDENVVRAELSRRLPEPMVPARIVTLEHLPLSANGKIDRDALPLPGAPRVAGACERQPSELERTIAAAWCEVLGVSRVGLDDDFFTLGGDSLLAIQVSSKLAARGVRLPAAAFFEHRTVAGQSASATREEAPSPAPVDEGEVPLGPGQRAFLDHGFGQVDAWNEGFILVCAQRLDAAVFRGAFRAVLEQHAMLRATIDRAEGVDRLRVADGSARLVEAEIVQLAGLTPDARAAAVLEVAGRLEASIDLARGPALVAALVSGAGTAEPDRVVVVGHQLVIDGFSWRIVLDDLQAAYRGLVRGEHPRLPPATSSFGSWTRFLADHANDPATLAEAPLWIGEHEGAPTDVLRDHPQAPSSESLTFHHVTFDETTTRKLLRAVTRAHGVTMQEVLLGGLARTLGAWLGRQCVGVDVLAHGRESLRPEVDVSRTVGRFTTTFPLALDASTSVEQSAKAAAARLRALPHRGLRYALLRQGSSPAARGLGAFAPAGVAFNYVGHFDPVLGGRDLFESVHDLPKRRTLVGPRRHDLELHGYVLNARLTLEWRYSASTHDLATIRQLSTSLADDLRAEARRCGAAGGAVLVVGATGALGGRVVRELLSSGKPVRALVRDPGGERGEALAKLGATLIAGDLADRAAIRAALEGCRAVVFSATGVDCKAGTGELETADRAGFAAIVEEAEATGVERFVYVSISGAITVDSPMLRIKRLAEERLARSSLCWTVLRSTFFFETWLCSASGLDPERRHAKLYGGGTRGVSYVAQADVARAASRAIEAGCWENRVVEIGGPTAVVPAELLQRMESALAQRFERELLDPERLRRTAEATSEPVLSSVLALRAAHGLGLDVDRSWAAEIGLELTSVDAWLTERGVAL